MIVASNPSLLKADNICVPSLPRNIRHNGADVGGNKGHLSFGWPLPRVPEGCIKFALSPSGQSLKDSTETFPGRTGGAPMTGEKAGCFGRGKIARLEVPTLSEVVTIELWAKSTPQKTEKQVGIKHEKQGQRAKGALHGSGRHKVH